MLYASKHTPEEMLTCLNALQLYYGLYNTAERARISWQHKAEQLEAENKFLISQLQGDE